MQGVFPLVPAGCKWTMRIASGPLLACLMAGTGAVSASAHPPATASSYIAVAADKERTTDSAPTRPAASLRKGRAADSKVRADGPDVMVPPFPQTDARPLHIEVTTGIDFSRISGGQGGGTVALDPRSGQRRATGGVRDIGGMAFTGEAIVTGTPGRLVRIDLPPRVTMRNSAGGTLTITDLITDLGPSPQLGRDGTLRFRIGGALVVTGEAEGSYNGRFAIDVDYQ